MSTRYILVDWQIAPEVFQKVAEAKNMLSSGKYRTINEILAEVKLSRSAFYKYKNYVFEHSQGVTQQIVTLFFTLDDISGILSDLLILISSAGANILTINQNIPTNGVANVTVSMRTEKMMLSQDELIERLKSVSGVNKIEILSM